MRYAGIAGKAPPARPERPLTRSAGFFVRSVPSPRARETLEGGALVPACAVPA